VTLEHRTKSTRAEEFTDFQRDVFALFCDEVGDVIGSFRDVRKFDVGELDVFVDRWKMSHCDGGRSGPVLFDKVKNRRTIVQDEEEDEEEEMIYKSSK